MAHLALVAIKFALIDSTSGYATLQNTVPNFLHLTAADPSLFDEQPHGNLVISFPRILIAPRHELTQFGLYDVTSAFLLGLPPLAEYGHDGECDSEMYKFEWIDGIPVALLQVISQVNSWRAGSRVRLDDWRMLEQRVLAWKSPYSMLDEASAPKSCVERAIVQEA
ncbi:hypothetical protein RSOLAG1IB_05062 [Rhizoctonia solani AG-1 IB]|uniref:Uncharacterized protein n=1 Tax=Thanatephorus cucumeris (strain AG1-IB / isolate 7/3/14) TaxID=1108050 RepID=A0A0B7FXN6_THACB|nr:hypothetical protein RSOLAG1IB_05062 [Rhizoctonia solani AG-1 IB]